MAKVITFSRYFQKDHFKAGKPTYFVEQILNHLNIKPWSQSYLNWLIQANPNLDEQILKDFQNSLVEGIEGIKLHTIREGKNFVAGESFSPRVWTKKPYTSKMLIFAPDIYIKNMVPINILLDPTGAITIRKLNGERINSVSVALNDGLNNDDFFSWFYPTVKDSKQEMKIICWGIEGY